MPTAASAPTWAPQEPGVQQICYLLSEYQKPGTNQSQILAQLEECKNIPDFNNYLAFILSQGNSLPVEVRQSAGLLLKNNLKKQYPALPEDYRQYVKLSLLHCIRNPSKPLRQTVGTSIAVIVSLGTLKTWPELITACVQSLEGSDLNALEGSLDALYKICEDVPKQLDEEVAGLPDLPSKVLIPRLLHLFSSLHIEAKCLAIGVANLLAGANPETLAPSLDSYVAGLFASAHDSHSGVRKAVCAGLVQMLQLQPERLAPHMEQIIEYMLESTQDGDEGVALESCEFWTAFCEAQVEPGVLRPFLGRLVPVLLKNMVYDEYDEEVQDAEAAEDADHVDDTDQEIKPFINRSAAHGEEEGEEDADEVSRWNMRKCSAAGLDVLSTVFQEELLPIVTPIVQQRLQEEDWRARESAILALGAIAEGCVMGLIPYLPQLVSMLLPRLEDPRPLVRSISCWALSRYAQWIVERCSDPQQDMNAAHIQLDEVLQGLLRHVLDSNKHVQEAACSALATLEEQFIPDLLIPRLRPILETLAKACATYGRKNLRILYDAISTLAEMAGKELADPSLLRIYMPPLVAKWQSLGDTDRDLLPLLECFTGITSAVGHAFEEFAKPMFDRCISIVTHQLAARAAAAAGQPVDPEPERDFIICSLDVIAGMAEGLGSSIESLVDQSHLRELLPQCCQDPSPDVRQSAFALVGDLSRVCAPHLHPVLKQLLALAIQNMEARCIDPHNMSACNNACWSLGELAIQCSPEQLQPFAAPIVERLVPILAAPMSQMPRSIVENSAITLGRVAWICPEGIAPHLGHFVGPWCAALRHIRDDVEKGHAFLGLCRLLRLNPQGALPSFAMLCEAFTSWRRFLDNGLHNEMAQVMQLYKQSLAAANQWDAATGSLPQLVRERLHQSFAV
ncbi:hypothetical protein ABBQ38_014866 [Trebouxia sp. C0009 RCD-2024]